MFKNFICKTLSVVLELLKLNHKTNEYNRALTCLYADELF